MIHRPRVGKSGAAPGPRLLQRQSMMRREAVLGKSVAYLARASFVHTRSLGISVTLKHTADF